LRRDNYDDYFINIYNQHNDEHNVNHDHVIDVYYDHDDIINNVFDNDQHDDNHNVNHDHDKLNDQFDNNNIRRLQWQLHVDIQRK
jgi:outer membrane cobalamin receptor